MINGTYILTQSAILLQVSFTKSRVHWNTIDITFSRLSCLVCFINLLCSPESPGMWESNKKENAITSIQSAGHEGCAAD